MSGNGPKERLDVLYIDANISYCKSKVIIKISRCKWKELGHFFIS